MSAALPQGFEQLEELVTSGWSLGSMNARMQKRRESTREELLEFYEKVLPRVEDILDYARPFEYPNLSEEGERLYYLLLSLVEVAPHVENFGGSPEVPYSFDERRMALVHGDVEGHWK